MNENQGSGTVIRASDLRMHYGQKRVLDGLDLTIGAEEVVAVLGPNGAGKSTLIEILEGFRARSGGEVAVLGEDPAHGGEAWRARLGVVLQNSGDHGKWRPRELLAHIARFYRPYVEPRDPDELLELVGLSAQAGQRIQTLSGGQRRRLDVALGIVGRPQVLFLDEPTTGFDPRARREFHELIHLLTDLEGTTIVLTTHDLAEAEKLADRIVVLAGGGIIADGSPHALTLAASATAEVRWKQDGQAHVHATEDATGFVRRLLASAQDAGGDGGAGEITDLEIQRATLEDAYLSIVERFEAGEPVAAAELREELRGQTAAETDMRQTDEGQEAVR
ncbi:ABC transporter ATP-binding protein [Brevibacterium album]|uniref:ABC transporter ATP-binding protein n=1 Tax=Brevibacterium album TaxID=417948 RepID=UPI000687201F|nr:ABC transporter ATP-binding protein [Brevibacterium album]